MFNQEIITAILVTLSLLAGMAGIGGGILCWCGAADTEDGAVKLFPISVALGFSVYSYLGYLLAFFAPVSPFVILSLAAAGIICGAFYWQILFGGARQRVKHLSLALKSPLVLIFAVLTLGTLFLAAMNWLTPPKEGDALWGYMFTARWLYLYGLNFIPYNPRYSLFPLNTELVYSFSFAFGTDLIAKLLDGLLGVCFLIGVYELARRCQISRLNSFFASISLALIPEFANNWSSGKVDVTACFIFFAGLSLLFWQKEQPLWRILLISAFLIGTACSQKYTFWIFAITFPVWIILILKDAGKLQIAKAIVLFAVLLVLCLIPHAVKNLVWASNPIAPFAQNIFNSGIQIIPHVSDADHFALGDLPVLPLRLFFQNYKLGPLPLLILLGLPWYFFSKNKPLLIKNLLIISVVQIAFWILVRQQDWLVGRFLLVQIAFLLIVSTFGLNYFSNKYSLIKVLIVLIMICLISYQGLWAARHRRASLPFIIGLEDRSQWQEKVAPGRMYGVLHKIAPLLTLNSRLMLVSTLYNVPEDKIFFVSTEAEYYQFTKTPDDQKVEYLKSKNFKFYMSTAKTAPVWTNELKVFDSRDTPGLEWTLFQLE